MKPRFEKWELPEIKHGVLTKWNWCAYHPEKIKWGKFIDVGMFTFLNAKNGIDIGDYVQFGPHCDITTENTINGTGGKIIIMRHATFGAHATVIPRADGKPLIIGEHSHIGAYSLITRNVHGNAHIKPYTKW